MKVRQCTNNLTVPLQYTAVAMILLSLIAKIELEV
jgi:hypothetical protein